VIDFHLAWCGACNIIEQNYRSLYFAYENAEQRIAFYNAQQDVIPQEIYSALKYGPLTCKPRFAIFIEGEKKEEVDGADFTNIEKAIKKFIPSLDD